MYPKQCDNVYYYVYEYEFCFQRVNNRLYVLYHDVKQRFLLSYYKSIIVIYIVIYYANINASLNCLPLYTDTMLYEIVKVMFVIVYGMIMTN